MKDVLIVEDKDSLRLALRESVEGWGHSVEDAGDVYAARRSLTQGTFAVVITDLRLPGGSGFDVLRAALEAEPETDVVVVTAFGSIEDAVRAMREGATDFLTKPVDPGHLQIVIARSLARRQGRLRASALEADVQERFALPRLVGQSAGLRAALDLVAKAAPTEANVLILGESGTGKELLARTVHQMSPRAKGPFVAINCAAIPEPLIENELFGHEKGAFTGAAARKLGRVETAEGGTLFLDEIGELPPALQPKILRLIQEKEFDRVGGALPRRANVRIVAATNRNLKAAAAAGQFREDLYFRLSVVPVSIPPLRDRPEDIAPLAEGFLARFGRELGRRRPPRFSDDALAALAAHTWPGNVRELQNCVERAAILSDSPTIRAADLRID